MSLTNTEIKEYIKVIQEFKNSPKLLQLKEENITKYNEVLEESFPLFKKNYSTLFKLVIEDKNLEQLDMLLNMKTKLENGENKVEVEKEMVGLLLKKKN